ncbi:carboxypeptidase-like regulatory domain-containing protein [Hymenobacter sp. NST-14]|uniref:carboxypeptidase-like regulatory domain-containing protein n=1 Tax=Hymenobacter piscis TaxID=2839984 RepID=UPI001C033048|nr:carboxypeptidase-like regulatory domain-containing protein [Hymenobacter piscis]MBT9393814.1 carboxypeptidase-like regulatory domain-containing protein [Hymenobacter piscis]
MKLNANPFHPVTGELLPAYRDAYLRGDLSSHNTELVDAFLKSDKQLADETLERFHELKQKGHQVQPVGWVQRQFDLLRTEPERFRRRAASLVAGGALVSGAVFAGANLPNTPTEALPAPTELAETAADANALRLTTVAGQILDENGKPLVGATVWVKGTQTGVSTDGQGRYNLRMAAGRPTILQYGYAGYTEEEVIRSKGGTANVTLLPRGNKVRAAKKRWLFF